MKYITTNLCPLHDMIKSRDQFGDPLALFPKDNYPCTHKASILNKLIY